MKLLFLVMPFLIGASAQAALLLHQSLSLSEKMDGLDGFLEVLRDERLTPDDLKVLQEHDPESNLLDGPRFKSSPPQVGVVQLKDRAGRILKTLSLEKTYGNLTTKDLRDGGKRVIFVTQDYSAGMGSYNGPISQVLEVSPTSMAWAEARKSGVGRAVKISLMQSLKTGWGYGPSTQAKGNDILKVSCRPSDLANGDISFKTTYSRFHRESKNWILTQKVENGCWENEGLDGRDLPDQKKFP